MYRRSTFINKYTCIFFFIYYFTSVRILSEENRERNQFLGEVNLQNKIKYRRRFSFEHTDEQKER